MEVKWKWNGNWKRKMEMEIGNGNGNAPIAGARLLAALLVPTLNEAR